VGLLITILEAGSSIDPTFSNFKYNKMKIALLGYGKMGQVIERIAIERGHEIILKKDENNTYDGLANADVAIDFSIPNAAVLTLQIV
jgi:dihydrodipicolinate reductase